MNQDIAANGSELSATSPDVEKLSKFLRGKVLLASDEENKAAYNLARQCFNADVKKFPQVIVQVQGAHDVIQALRFAKAHNLSVSVAGGRHMFSGRSMVGQLVVDTRLLRQITVHKDEQYAWVGSGCTVRDVDLELYPYDMAVVGGQYPDTGIAGFTLGGGVGNISPKHGLAVDSLLAVEIVTADGEVRYVDDDVDPELMWAIRGAGWALGVVLRFKLKAHRLEAFGHGEERVHGHAGFLMWEAEGNEKAIVSIVEKLQELNRENRLPKSTQPLVAIGNPPPLGGKPGLVFQHAWIGSPEDGAAFAKQFTDMLEPTVNTLQNMNYIDLQAFHAALFPENHYYYVSNRATKDDAFLAPGSFAKLFKHLMEGRPENAILGYIPVFGAVLDVAADATACTSLRSSKGAVILISMADASQPDMMPMYKKGCEWVKQALCSFMQPYLMNTFYANISNVELENEVEGCQAYSPGALDRLVVIKKAVDPDNVFQFGKLF